MSGEKHPMWRPCAFCASTDTRVSVAKTFEGGVEAVVVCDVCNQTSSVARTRRVWEGLTRTHAPRGGDLAAEGERDHTVTTVMRCPLEVQRTLDEYTRALCQCIQRGHAQTPETLAGQAVANVERLRAEVARLQTQIAGGTRATGGA